MLLLLSFVLIGARGKRKYLTIYDTETHLIFTTVISAKPGKVAIDDYAKDGGEELFTKILTSYADHEAQ